MIGSNLTTEPASAGHGRSSVSWWSRVALVALVLGAVFALPGIARANSAANIDQCRNGSFASQNRCIDAAFQNGNLGSTNSHYREDDSVPFRAVVTGITTGATPHSLLIQWDTLQGGKHAYDYLRSYNASELDADPVHDIAGQTPGNCVAIPTDPTVVFTQAGAVQKPGSICIWNGTITSLVYGSALDGAGQRSITVNFTATDSTAVIAWGGHIASQLDWGLGNSASAISGSPYHMRLLTLDDTSLGNQDRSLKADAIPPIPNLTTQASSATFSLGNSVTDTATLTGTNGAVTGTIQFQTCGPDLTVNPACDASNSTDFGSPVTIDVTGHATSPAFTPGAVGHYCFRAVFTPASSAVYSPTAATNTTTECFNVTAAGVSVVTVIHNAAHAAITTAAIGSIVHDSVSVTGPIGTPTGTVSFTVYLGVTDCSTAGTAAGSGSLSSGAFDNTATTATVPVGGLSYKAHYGGDPKYAAADGACEPLTGTKLTPTVVTNIHNAAHGVITHAPIGSVVHDSIAVSGSNGAPTGAVTFTVYPNSTCASTGTAEAGGNLDGSGNFDNSGNTDTLGATGLSYIGHYAGDGVYNAADGACEPLTPDKLTPTVVTNIHDAAHAVITNAAIGSTVHDSVSVTGSNAIPTGAVTFTVWTNSTCSSNGSAEAGGNLDGSGNFDNVGNTDVVGANGLSYKAHYAGDSVYTAGDGACEPLTPDKLTPTVVTNIHNAAHAVITNAAIGSTVHDSVSVTGSNAVPSGAVTFTVWTNSTCSNGGSAEAGGSLDGSGNFDNTANTDVVGANGLSYKAHYAGNSVYTAGDGACEPLTPNKLTPTVVTNIHNAAHAVITDASIGSTVHDSVSVTGSNAIPTGAVTFTVYPNSTCASTGTAEAGGSLNGSGNFDNSGNTDIVGANGLSYVGHYAGDSVYDAADGACEPLSPDKLTPTVVTKIHNAAHAVITDAPIGSTVHDSVAVTGSNAIPSGAVTFTVWTNSTCSNGGSAEAGGSLDGSGNFDNTANTDVVGANGLSYKAHYAGDSVYTAGDGACEPLTPDKLTPTVVTNIHNAAHAVITDAPIGSTVHDSVAVTGSNAIPSGAVTFTVWTNSTCSNGGSAEAGGSLDGSGNFDNTAQHGCRRRERSVVQGALRGRLGLHGRGRRV